MDKPDGRIKVKAAAGSVPERKTAEEAAFVRYLQQNPDFFLRNPELFDRLQSPPAAALRDGDPGLVDFRAAQIRHLQKRNLELQDKTGELLAASRQSLSVLERVHEAVLVLLAAPSFEHFVDCLTLDLSFLMDLDAISLVIEELPGGQIEKRLRNGVFLVPQGFVDSYLGLQTQKLLLAETTGDERLYGPAAGIIASEALFRLFVSSETPPALLAFGSRQPGHFDAGQGTEFLTFLVQVIEKLILSWLSTRA